MTTDNQGARTEARTPTLRRVGGPAQAKTAAINVGVRFVVRDPWPWAAAPVEDEPAREDTDE